MNRNDDEEKKGFEADIPQELLDEAVKSVSQKAQKRPKGLPEEPVAVEVKVEPEGDESEAGAGDERRRGPSRQELIDALEKSRAEAKAAREKMLRALADVDNQRKRLARERQEIIKFGNEGLLRDLLVPLDNLERTMEHLPADSTDPAIVALRDGLKMVVKQFADVLAKYGLKGFSAVGQPFDPTRHEALQQQQRDDVEPGTVVEEMHKGYMLHDRLLRPALVTVAVRGGAERASGQEGPESGNQEGERPDEQT